MTNYYSVKIIERKQLYAQLIQYKKDKYTVNFKNVSCSFSQI
jgi:hypothetical protein